MFSPWEVNIFKDFLKDKESLMKGKVNSDFTKQIISMIFEILQAELNYEMEIADKEFSQKFDERNEMAKEERIVTRAE